MIRSASALAEGDQLIMRHTALTSPCPSRVGAENTSRVRSSSSARFRPARRGSLCVPPNVGAMASLDFRFGKASPLARYREMHRFGHLAAATIGETG